MNKIYWLASYPKSGNTWVRVFLSNYLRDSDEPADINRLNSGPIASDRDLFDRWAGVEASDLGFDEIADLRPHVYRQMALHTAHPLYIKVHDACVRNREGELLFPVDVTGGVVYLIRNPLDVAVSYSHHGGGNLEHTVAILCASNGYVYVDPTGISDQLPQRLLSWSAHVRSWVDESGMPLTVIRYEDILAQPAAQFERLLRALELDSQPQRIAKAVSFSRFETVQEQEHRAGFREKHLRADAPFFRRGRAGAWRTELPHELAQEIILAHRDVMHRFGYVDADGAPLP